MNHTKCKIFYSSYVMLVLGTLFPFEKNHVLQFELPKV